MFTSAQVGLDKEDYEVRVEQGVLLGKLWTVDGRKVQVFKGVPYAEPPEGERRFQVRKAFGMFSSCFAAAPVFFGGS